MKKLLALMLSAAMALSLVACGGSTQSIKKTLVENKWKAVLDYFWAEKERTMTFNEDGTGTLVDTDGVGGDIVWDMQKKDENQVVTIEWKTKNFRGQDLILHYTLNYVEVNGLPRLVEDNEADDTPHYWIFVPADNYKTEIETIKTEQLEKATPLELTQDLLSEMKENSAKFESKYVGVLWKFEHMKVINYRYGGDNVAEIYQQDRYNTLTINLSNSDLVELDETATYTVVGTFKIEKNVSSNCVLVNSFIIKEGPEEPAPEKYPAGDVSGGLA